MLLTMLAAVNPRTMAMMDIRISLATDTIEGETSRECLMFRLVKATACLTPTSERSICTPTQRSSTCSIPFLVSIGLDRHDRNCRGGKTKPYTTLSIHASVTCPSRTSRREALRPCVHGGSIPLHSPDCRRCDSPQTSSLSCLVSYTSHRALPFQKLIPDLASPPISRSIATGLP